MQQIIADHQMIAHPACEGWFVQQYRGDLKVSLANSTEKLVRFRIEFLYDSLRYRIVFRPFSSCTAAIASRRGDGLIMMRL